MALSLAFRTWISTDTPGASDFNRLQDNDVWLAQRPMIVARRESVASIPHATAVGIGFEFNDIDTDNIHDPVSNSQKFFVPYTGYWDMRCGVLWDAPGGGAAPAGNRSLRIERTSAATGNVNFVPGGRVDQGPNPRANEGTGMQLAPNLMRVFAGDALRVVVVQSQGATVNIGEATFSMIWIRTS